MSISNELIPYVKFKTRDEINAIPINECGELLVEIIPNQYVKLRQGDSAKWLIPKLRETPCKMLFQAPSFLPAGYSIMVMSAYIPMWMQQQVWDKKLEKLRAQNPDWNEEKLLGEVVKYAARPVKGAPHHTGGSVDVILLDQDGFVVDMGSDFGDPGKINHTRYGELTDTRKQNRAMLYNAMTRAGFINTNPFEWWHYAYGDRAWAAYAGKEYAIYDGIEQ